MGCFSSSAPKLTVPDAPKLPSAGELYGQAAGFAKQEAPQAYGAREGALQDLMLGTEYYDSFQPTSFEQALGDQYFQNVWPDTQKTIKQGLSMSGIESSPILAEQLGQARGQLGFDIGSFLSNQGNERAQYSLNQRLGIDPYSMLNPYANTGANQSQAQGNFDWNQQMAQAQADYQNQMQDYQSKGAGISSIGSILGGGAGFLMGGPGGAALGASLGGTASSLFGGSQSPISMGDAMEVYQSGQPQTYNMFPSQYGNELPEPGWMIGGGR